MAPKKAPVTSARTRQERIKGTGKAPASTPQKRPTTTMQRPFQPGTRTSNTTGGGGGSPSKPPVTRQSRVQGRVVKGTDTRPSPSTRGRATPTGGMVNSNTPAMRQIQAKAAASRARAQGQPGIKGPINPPNSARAGQNLIGQGARNLRMAAVGTMSAAQRTMLQAQGAARKAAAQTRRGAKAAMSNMSNTLATKGSVRAGRPVGGAGRGAVGGAIEQAASAALGPLARKAGTALGKSIKGAMTPKPTKKVADSFSGQNQKGKAAPSKAPKMSKAKSFDNAFASARNSGMKTFVWEGKKYNTKMK